MTTPAEETEVLETTLATAVRDRNNVIRLPARPSRAPAPPRGPIGHRWFRARPLAMRLDHVQAAQAANPFVAFLDFAAHVPRTAADLPLVHARVAAERPARADHRT